MKNATMKKAAKKVREVKHITRLQLLNILMTTEIKGGTFFGLLTNTEEKNIAKPKTCGLAGLRKVVGTVGHVYAHHQYANQMKKVDATYESKPRTWGVRLPNKPLVEHNGKYYLEVFFDNGRSKGKNFGYFLAGKEIPKEIVYANMLPKKEETIVYRNYSLDSIMEIVVAKQRYKIID